MGANDQGGGERSRREPAAASHCICSLFQQLPSRTCAHKANTQEQRYLAAAWPTNAMRDPRRGAATEMSRGEYATAMRETHLGRLLALPHRARSPTAPKRTEAGPCTWSAPPSPSARFLGVISDNTRRGRADDGAEASGLRRRPVGRRALGRHLATPLTGLRACTQPCVACETVKVNSETDRPLWVDHAHAARLAG